MAADEARIDMLGHVEFGDMVAGWMAVFDLGRSALHFPSSPLR